MRAGIRAFVVIDHEPLAAFLRQAENPSHTQWQTYRVKRDYVYAPSLVGFVTRSVSETYRLAMAEDKEVDKRLLADFFPMPDTSGPGNHTDNGDDPVNGGGNGGSGQPNSILITNIAGGFMVSPGRIPPEAGDRIKICVAYAVRRGNAFNRYLTTDFELDQSPIEYQHEGVVIEEVGENRMVVLIEDSAFRVSVTGFDGNRDIRVTADKTRDNDANP